MELTKISQILNSVGIQASAGKQTMIIRDINTNIAMCEFICSEQFITVKVMRLDVSNEFTIAINNYTTFELLDLMLDVAGGIV